MVSYADAQRLFLQAVFSRGIMSGKVANLLWEKCMNAVAAADDSIEFPRVRGKEEWGTFLVQVNRSIDSLDLEFRQFHDESSGKEMYALVNRKSDKIAQMATDYTPTEIMYFKALIEQIMLAPHESFCVSSLAALREVSIIKPKSNMSKAQAEVVLGSFVAKGWLLKTKQGRYCLSTRTLLELQGYLKNAYPDEFLECTICTEVLTRGVACHTKNCRTRMHTHCFIAYRRRRNLCPTCSTDWPRAPTDKPLLPVGEAAVRHGDDGKRRVRMRDVEDSEEDEFIDGEETPGPRSQYTREINKGKARTNYNMDIDKEDEEEPKSSATSTQAANYRSSRM
ncbi:Nse1 non-SMC component of SMC5-6 complex-domain-containing protein [Collybia nuda]|uniref:Non-structural maintenance of chromosomes element 1 homolog n=1 Tax=Collybia nuda TaxID=64659 RepID=A0A9P6C8Z2_9AGAR|nr:Nse1 non-SMC component of SMC5-6 complex-domain-containing protein [Collybia nuda]